MELVGSMNERIFKRSQIRPIAKIEVLADKGYQGIAKLHPNSRTPKKKPKGGTLNQTDKQCNRELARARVVCEHVIGKLKVFKILAERYRKRRRRWELAF